MNLHYTKIRPVKSPCKGHNRDAGIDFFIPDYNEQFLKDLREKNKTNNFAFFIETEKILLYPHNRILIPSGLKINVPCNTALIAFNKSSMGIQGLIVGACVIDPGYQGEVHISLINTSSKSIELICGQKIIQFILLPLIEVCITEIQSNLYDSKSSRGEGGFGSTNSLGNNL